MSDAVHVLLVDDDQLVREGLRLALQSHGVDVTTATSFDVDSVLQLVHESEPRVVLLDFHLDGTPSSPLIDPIVKAGPVVVMLTGETSPEVLGACLELGAAGAILKRQPLDELVRAIELAVEGLAPQRPQERDDLIEASRTQRAARAEALAPFEALSARERSVLSGLCDGLSAEEIAARDFVSLATVRTQIRAVLTKLDVTSQLAAVARARRVGWSG